MNLLLFEADELATPLPRHDPRAVHVLDVLRRREGETFDIGLVDGPRGQARVTRIHEDHLELAFVWTPTSPASLDPLTLIIGLPRPQTARKILQEATALGVGTLHFVLTEKGDANYAQSTLWSSGEWRRHLITGAEQAFSTRLPVVTWGRSLASTLAAVVAGDSATNSHERLALDVYEAVDALAARCLITDNAPPPGIVLAFGPERGWGPRDRELLRQHAFTLVHLGQRVLRSETAVVAATALVKARLRTF